MAKRFDIADFEDPVAEKTSWMPLNPNGFIGLHLNALAKITPTRYIYEYSKWIKWFVNILGLTGVLVLLNGIDLFFARGFYRSFSYFMTAIVIMITAYIFYSLIKVKMVFDFSLGCYWTGGKEPKFSGNLSKNQRITYFNTVHAIQILSKKVQDNIHISLIYEMNFVLQDGSRVNVFTHLKKNKLLKDARLLSTQLKIPIWDVSN